MKKRALCSAILVGTAMMLMNTCTYASKINFADVEIIKIVQEKLNAAGFDCGTPDGIAGSGTRAAIQSFRESKGLTKNEEIDAELFNALTLSKEQSGFVNAVLDASDGNLGEGEKLKEVTLYNNDLCLSVDLGDTSNSTLPVEELAYSRVSSLTDAILELDNFEHLWDTITVDFGDLGEVVNSKDGIQDSGYGKYFDSAQFQLSKTSGTSDDKANTEPAEEESAAESDGVTPEVKEYLDAYEAFMNKYCDFMENYDASDLSALTEYLSLMQEYAEYVEKTDAMDETNMTDADYKYYIDVLARVDKRLIDVSSSY